VRSGCRLRGEQYGFLVTHDEALSIPDDVHRPRCLEIQRSYLGTIAGNYTDWTPLTNRPGLFADDLDPDDPWQFRNVLVH
jgi:homospermidine synthase